MSNGNVYERLWKLDPAAFIAPGWKYSKLRDERSAALGAVIDYTKVKLSRDWLRSGENFLNGDERRQRILADQSVVALNCDHFLRFWKNPSEIPEEWKSYIITFDGDELLSPLGDRFVLCLYWLGERWHWLYRWLDREYGARCRAAVLAV